MSERCDQWIIDDPSAKPWPRGHLCGAPATHYVRVGGVVETVCAEHYRIDIYRGASPATAEEYAVSLNDEDC